MSVQPAVLIFPIHLPPSLASARWRILAQRNARSLTPAGCLFREREGLDVSLEQHVRPRFLFRLRLLFLHWRNQTLSPMWRVKLPLGQGGEGLNVLLVHFYPLAHRSSSTPFHTTEMGDLIVPVDPPHILCTGSLVMVRRIPFSWELVYDRRRECEVRRTPYSLCCSTILWEAVCVLRASHFPSTL